MVLHYGDLTDSTCLVHIVSQVQPSEIYNLGAQSHVKVSFDMADYTAQVDALGTLRLLDAVRTCGLADKVRVYQASTSELYGKVVEVPQKETTPFYPRSPYGTRRASSPYACPLRPRARVRAAHARCLGVAQAWPSCTGSGSPKTTARRTACFAATASSSTTRARAAVRLPLRD
jgi:hypothetical protein